MAASIYNAKNLLPVPKVEFYQGASNRFFLKITTRFKMASSAGYMGQLLQGLLQNYYSHYYRITTNYP
jgi:hypothetical protein